MTYVPPDLQTLCNSRLPLQEVLGAGIRRQLLRPAFPDASDGLHSRGVSAEYLAGLAAGLGMAGFGQATPSLLPKRAEAPPRALSSVPAASLRELEGAPAASAPARLQADGQGTSRGAERSPRGRRSRNRPSKKVRQRLQRERDPGAAEGHRGGPGRPDLRRQSGNRRPDGRGHNNIRGHGHRGPHNQRGPRAERDTGRQRPSSRRDPNDADRPRAGRGHPSRAQDRPSGKQPRGGQGSAGGGSSGRRPSDRPGRESRTGAGAGRSRDRRCPVHWCSGTDRSLFRHAMERHLPLAFGRTSNDRDTVEDIWALRREYWEQLCMESGTELDVHGVVEGQLRELKEFERRERGGVVRIPSELRKELGVVFDSAPARYYNADSITELGTRAKFSWRLALHAQNLLRGRKACDRLLLELGGPGWPPKSTAEDRRRMEATLASRLEDHGERMQDGQPQQHPTAGRHDAPVGDLMEV